MPIRRPFVDHLAEIALRSDEIISYCVSTLSNTVNDTENECKWTRVMNLDGVCYTLNMIDSKELFYDNV